jgi:hypothetical protein
MYIYKIKSQKFIKKKYFLFLNILNKLNHLVISKKFLIKVENIFKNDIFNL